MMIIYLFFLGAGVFLAKAGFGIALFEFFGGAYWCDFGIIANICILGIVLNLIGSFFLVKAIIGKNPIISIMESSTRIGMVVGGYRQLNPFLLRNSFLQRWDAFTGLWYLIIGSSLQVIGKQMLFQKLRFFCGMFAIVFSLVIFVVYLILRKWSINRNLRKSLLYYHAEIRLHLGDNTIIKLLEEVFGSKYSHFSSQEWYDFMIASAKKVGFTIKDRKDV